MFACRKDRSEIPVQQLVPIAVEPRWCNQVLRHFHNLLGNHFVRLLPMLDRAFLLVLKLWRNVLLQTHGGLAINILELSLFGYFFVLGEQRVLGLAELLFEHKLAPDEQLAHNDNVQKTVLRRVQITVLVHVRVQLGNLGLDLVDQRLVLDLLHLLMSKQVLVKLLQQRKQAGSQLKQDLHHLGPCVTVLPTQIDGFLFFIIVGLTRRLVLPSLW